MNNTLQPKVGVITINFDQIDYTLDCIESILKSDYYNYEILLVDNGSNTENFKSLTDRLPEDNKINILKLQTNIGYTGGINHALKQANELDCDYFLIMNNDTLIDQNAIKELVITSEKYNGKAIVSGKTYNYNKKKSLQYIGQKHNPKDILNQLPYVKNRDEEDLGQYDSEMEMGMLDDIFWIFSAQIYQNVGQYSDYFFLYGEQNDFALRALKKGFKLIYTHKAKIWHKGSITSSNGDSKSPKIYYWNVFATFKLATLHLSKNKYKRFYMKFTVRNYMKYFLLILINKSNFKYLKAFHLARKNFKHWDKIRYIDNGYNPFN